MEKENTHWDGDLYIKCVQSYERVREENLITNISINAIIYIIKEVYDFYASSKNKTIDDDFTKWVIRKQLS